MSQEEEDSTSTSSLLSSEAEEEDVSALEKSVLEQRQRLKGRVHDLENLLARLESRVEKIALSKADEDSVLSSHDDFTSRDVTSLEDSKINMVSSSSSSSSSDDDDDDDDTSSLPEHNSKSLGLINVSLLSVEHDHLVEENEETSVLSTSKENDSRKKTETFLHDPTKTREKSHSLSHDSKPKKVQKDHSFLTYITRKKDPIRREDDFVKHVYMSLATTSSTKRRSMETTNNNISELSCSEVAPQLPLPDHSVEDHSVKNKILTSESEEDEQLVVPDRKDSSSQVNDSRQEQGTETMKRILDREIRRLDQLSTANAHVRQLETAESLCNALKSVRGVRSCHSLQHSLRCQKHLNTNSLIYLTHSQ